MWYRKILAQARQEGQVRLYHLNIPLSKTAQQIIRQLNDAGKRALIVGGAVRDAVSGHKPKDIDIEVHGVSYDELTKILSAYGRVDLVGQAFGTIKFTDPEGFDYDFSVPRRDSKKENDPSRHGFDVEFNPNMHPRDAMKRRDFTFNAMAYDPVANELHDYFNGRQDLENGIIRHTSDQFAEDPLRVLRGMQFASRFGFRLAPETALLARKLAQQIHAQHGGPQDHPDDLVHEVERQNLMTWDGRPFFDPTKPHHTLTRSFVVPDEGMKRTISRERLGNGSPVSYGEFMKWALKSRYPSRMLNYLDETGWDHFFPEIANMKGVPQDPEWHPEGEVNTHVGHVMDQMVHIADREGIEGENRAVLMFSALLHDVAKSPTTMQREKNGQMRWTAHGHEPAGGPMAEAFLQRIGIKPEITNQVKPLIENHLVHAQYQGKEIPNNAVRRLARRLAPANIQMLAHLVEADTSGRPPLPKGLPPTLAKLRDMAIEQQVALKPMEPLIRGRHIMPYFGNKGGPHIGQVERAAMEAQEAGEFSDETGANQWLTNHLAQQSQ